MIVISRARPQSVLDWDLRHVFLIQGVHVLPGRQKMVVNHYSNKNITSVSVFN